MPLCCFPARGVKTDCRASADHPLEPCRARSSAGAARDPPKPRRLGRIAPPGALRSGRPGMLRLTRARRRDFAIAEVSATSFRTVVRAASAGAVVLILEPRAYPRNRRSIRCRAARLD